MTFRDRIDAADRLSERLAVYRGQNPLILAIPRGAVPMAERLAERLEGELDVVLVHKLGAPGNPEYAVGSIDEFGSVYLTEAAAELGISKDYLESERAVQLETLKKRRAAYTPIHAPIDPGGRVVIVVDDGVATGSTMISALRAVRARKPQRLIAAVGVAPYEVPEKIAAEADEVVCLEAPKVFYAVGEFFSDFSQVSDDEVMDILRRARARRSGPTSPP